MSEQSDDNLQNWNEEPTIVGALDVAFEKHRTHPWIIVAVADYCAALPCLGLPQYDEKNPGWAKLAIYLRSKAIGTKGIERIGSIQRVLADGFGRRLISIIIENQKALDAGEIITVGSCTKEMLRNLAQTLGIALNPALNISDVRSNLKHETQSGRLITRARLISILSQEHISSGAGRSGRVPRQIAKMGMTNS